MSSVSIQSYQYESLLGPRVIRILVLEPSDNLYDPLHGTVKELHLDSNPPGRRHHFEALSYVWGERQGTQPLICDGKTILVTKNCEVALRYLRLPREKRAIWIDSVCINQASTAERALQVPLMEDIYSSATRTLIWLGVGQETDKVTFRRASSAASINRLKERLPKGLFFRNAFDRMTRWWPDFWHGIDEDLKDFSSICSNDWFERIWTLQECFLGKSPTLVSGYNRLSLDDFTEYDSWLDLSQGDAFSKANVGCFTRIASLVTIPPFRGAAGITESLRREYVPDIQADPGAWGQFRKFLPYWLHQATFFNRATDPRDKVYGLLGILGRFMPEFRAFPVDYERPVPDVYEAFSRFLIHHTRRLSYFELVYDKLTNVPGLPGWVFDVGGDSTGWVFVLVGGPLEIHAAKESEVDMDLLAASPAGELHLRGVGFSEVLLVSPRIPEEADTRRKCFRYLLQWGPALTTAEAYNNRYPDMWDPVRRVIETKQVIDRFITNGVFFVTTSGHLGMSRHEIQPGDEVAILAGSDLPVVLRHQPDGKCKFLGPSAVAGTEKGEFWDDKKPLSEMEVFVLI